MPPARASAAKRLQGNEVPADSHHQVPRRQTIAVPCSTVPPLSRLLVVEHDASLVTLFADVLQTHFGCQTVTAGSFPEAVRHLETHRFDFVVSDLVLPGGDGSGLDLGERLRAHQPVLGKRFIIVTATSGNAELARAVQRGEVRVLYKPFNATGLIEAVEQAVQAE